MHTHLIDHPLKGTPGKYNSFFFLRLTDDLNEDVFPRGEKNNTPSTDSTVLTCSSRVKDCSSHILHVCTPKCGNILCCLAMPA